MQVDFLETNPEYGMCYTRARQFIQKNRTFLKTLFGKPVIDFNDLLQNGNRIPTLTVMLRKALHEKYREEIHPENKDWLMGDYPTWLYVAHESKVKFLDSVTSVYRVLEESASHSQDPVKIKNFNISVLNIQMFFLNYSGLKSEKQLDFAIYAFTNGEKKKGIEYLSNLHITDIKGKKRKLKYLVLKNNFLRTLYILKRNLNKM